MCWVEYSCNVYVFEVFYTITINVYVLIIKPARRFIICVPSKVMVMFSRFIHNLYNATTSICNINYVIATVFHCMHLVFRSFSYTIATTATTRVFCSWNRIIYKLKWTDS
nr:MAG TPA: hypothetical protein [Caudoviricetes sp.]